MIWSLVNLILVAINKLSGAKLAVGPLGCRSNPVRCDGPAGEREYLDRIRGKDGRKVLYQRVGSLVVPSPSGNIVDLYLIGFENVGPVARVFMDMYFAGYVEVRPIPGFQIEMSSGLNTAGNG